MNFVVYAGIHIVTLSDFFVIMWEILKELLNLVLLNRAFEKSDLIGEMEFTSNFKHCLRRPSPKVKTTQVFQKS